MVPSPKYLGAARSAIPFLLAATVAAGCAGRNTSTEQTTAAGAAVSARSGSAPPEDASTAAPGTMPVKPDVEPQHVQVQHILIGFAGSVPGKAVTRTREEARALAYEILGRARNGENFDSLVRQYTDDSPPGIYDMSATGVAPGPGEFARDRMVPAFGNVGFAIGPGNIGIADYDPESSPFGWHIIKRLK
jgi:hypothetical protein